MTSQDILALDDLELERHAIVQTLRKTAGDKGAAARILGMAESTLYRRLKFYGLAVWF